MRIAFLVDAFPAISESFILNQITGLIDRGHEVVIFAGGRPEEREFHKDIQDYDLLNHTFYHNDIPKSWIERINLIPGLLIRNIFRNPMPIIRSLNVFKYGKEALSLTYFYKVLLFMNLGAFDVIYGQFGSNGNLGAILKEIGITGSLIVMFHGYDIRRGVSQGGNIYKDLFKRADAILSISDYNEKNLLQFGAKKEQLIHHPVGIDLKRYQFQEKIIKVDIFETFKILTIGRFVEEKGLMEGLETIKRLVEQKGIKHLEYQIVGDGPLMGSVKEFVHNNKLDNFVHLFGLQQQEGVVKILHEADIFFLPSRAEALPVVLMEAQAVGLPVVATNVGSVSQVVLDKESGFLVPAKNIDQMVDKLEYLIKNPENWNVMGKKGRDFIENNYDIDVLNDRLVKIFQNYKK